VTPDSEVHFRRCQTLSGRYDSVGVGRRNGRLALQFTPEWQQGGPEPTTPSPWLDDPRLYVNLNEVEQRTWRQILSGLTINAIAASEEVARGTIYARIQGNRFGHGGMIGKNVWVLLWWRLRRRLLEQGRIADARIARRRKELHSL
jgi:hypothetical protein